MCAVIDKAANGIFNVKHLNAISPQHVWQVKSEKNNDNV